MYNYVETERGGVIVSSKIVFDQVMLGYELKGRKMLMDIKNMTSGEFVKNVVAGVIAGIIVLALTWIFGNLLGSEICDVQLPPSSLSSAWEVEHDAFRSAEIIRERLRYTYWEQSSYIQVEQVKCKVRWGDSTDGFQPDAILLCEEVFLDYRYRNGDLPDRLELGN